MALAAARLRLRGKHEEDGLQSDSLRQALSDVEGGFSFSQLGPGPHQLEVTATGFESQVVAVDAEREDTEMEMEMEMEIVMEIRLSPTGRRPSRN